MFLKVFLKFFGGKMGRVSFFPVVFLGGIKKKKKAFPGFLLEIFYGKKLNQVKFGIFPPLRGLGVWG